MLPPFWPAAPGYLARRLPRPGIALLGVVYLWRWTALVVGDDAQGLAGLTSNRNT